MHSLRSNEKVLLAYFSYTAFMAAIYGLPWERQGHAWLLVLALFGIFALESRYSNLISSALRDWLPQSLILVGYYQVQWFVAPPKDNLHEAFMRMDRLIFGLGFQQAVEVAGPVIPQVCETVYLLLYTFPPLCMAILYIGRNSQLADRFLFPFYLTTFTVYALLPQFPTLAPRIVYPEEFTPHFTNFFRTVNLWNLNNIDISTSVFPSGHVAVAFGSVYGLYRCLPRRKRLWGALLVAAIVVYVTTVYSRYHYAADGLASILIAAAANWVAGSFSQDSLPDSTPTAHSTVNMTVR
ncbi:MAG: phosphatase PAP2 family protein [Candidatus Solibacter usitatus]|nr:phosphatase PAP2 family protein [Candidatus Solibacter usitatus]